VRRTLGKFKEDSGQIEVKFDGESLENPRPMNDGKLKDI